MTKFAQPTTAELIVAFRAGDTDAWTRIDGRYRARLARLMRHKIPPYLRPRFDTDDVVQSTILSAYEELDQFVDEGEHSFRRWISKILQNGLRSRVRFHSAQARNVNAEAGSLEPHEAIDQAHEDTPEIDRADQLAHLFELVEELPDDDRELLIGRFFDDLSFDELGARLNVTPRTARRRVAKLIVVLGFRV